MSGCVNFTSNRMLPILSGVDPPDIRRTQQTLQLADKAQERKDHLVHKSFFQTHHRHRLTSRKPWRDQALLLLSQANGLPPKLCSRIRNIESYQQEASYTRLRRFIHSPTTNPPGADLPRELWVKLNRIRSGARIFNASKHRFGWSSSGLCECGREQQTADHLMSCPDMPEVDELEIACVGPAAVEWLKALPPI